MGKFDIDPWNEENWNEGHDNKLLDNLIGSTFIGFDRNDDVFYSHGRFEEETFIKLEFDNYILKFDGYLFEHNKPLVGKKVKYVYNSQSLGFKAIMQIDYCDLLRSDYGQAYIGMENSDKLEMLIVYRNLELIEK